MDKFYFVTPNKCECGRQWLIPELRTISSIIENDIPGIGEPVCIGCSGCNKKYYVTWVSYTSEYFYVTLTPKIEVENKEYWLEAHQYSVNAYWDGSCFLKSINDTKYDKYFKSTVEMEDFVHKIFKQND